MLGGLSQRVALVNKMRTNGQPSLVVDSGDLFFTPYGGPDNDRAITKARLISRTYKYMGAVALNVGELDLLQGLDFLKQEAAQGIPLVSANLVSPEDQKALFYPYVISEVAGIRVAFFGLLSPELGPAVSKPVRDKILVKDPVEVARGIVASLSGRADLVVLLSDMGLAKDQQLAQAVPGIHFILGGHEGRYIVHPQQEGKTYIVQSSVKGMYVGSMKLTLENPKEPFKDKGASQYLIEQIRNIDIQILSFQRARPGQPEKKNIDVAVQKLTQQKAKLQEELNRVSSESYLKGNLFNWSLEPLETSMPGDPQVREWLQEAGFEND
jgi:2',3'-cyclic-nucleotide 2'-phosphodiesterase (5'-nucleotidase family)